MINHVALVLEALAAVESTGELFLITMGLEMSSQNLPLTEGSPAAEYITPEWFGAQMHMHVAFQSYQASELLATTLMLALECFL